MKKYILVGLIGLMPFLINAQKKVYTTYLWHLQQPIYWPEKGQTNQYHYQTVKESQDIKDAGGNDYGTGVSHPTNNLYDIFSKADRVNAYQQAPKESVNTMLSYPNAGAQVNYSGCLIENVNSLADAGQWGYYSGWQNNFITARNWTTSGGYPRMDIVGFTFHHALSPLVSERALRKEIEAHKLIYGDNFGTSPNYSNGYWPAECAFSERIIKVLSEEGFKWSVIANSHLARTLSDYPLHYGTNGCNIDPPNKADIIPTTGNNWWNGQIDGRGGEFAAPYCYQAHKAKYVDPETGAEYFITVVPMADLLSYKDGYAPMSTDDITTHILPYSTTSHPSIVLLAHDGDNAFAGGYSYYHESVPDFVGAVENNSEMQASTIDQFLADNPVPSNDIVHVEDGAWVNAANDWGHPQFINWLWPLYNSSDYTFNPDAWTEDARNWAVITAIDNYACMAEDLAGGTTINGIVYANSSSTEAELAWHFYLPALTSGYMYYGTAEDMEVKQTIAGNNAISHAQNVINAHPGVDNTPPSVFIPQRFPYNPGGKGFGPIYGYQEVTNSSDFTVWTYAYDVSGIQTSVLKYRLDEDGQNPLTDDINETYAGGTGVSEWLSLPMNKKILDSSYNGGNNDVDFFVLPTAIASLYYAEITGLKDTLVDYYVEMTDNYGNTFKTPIQHVWVGNETGSNAQSYLYWTPENPTKNDVITIVDSNATADSYLHWGVTVDGASWNAPIAQYQPAGTIPFDSNAVETPFSDPDSDGVYTVQLGPLNNASQIVEKVNFVVKLDANTWDNNNGSDYAINIENNVTNNPVSSNFAINMFVDETYNFSPSDFYFYSPTGATFNGIRVIAPPTAGTLKYNNVTITDSIDCPDVNLLSFTPQSGESGTPYADFSFKVVDSSGLASSNTYTATINVLSYNPIGGNSSVTISVNQNYTFRPSDFPFTGMNGASFNGIKIISTQSNGTLQYDGNDVIANQICNNVSLLTFAPNTDESGSPYATFSFKVIDSDNRLSEEAYTMTINVIGTFQSGVSWYPENPTSNDQITIFVTNDPKMNTSGKLHWGVNKVNSTWTMPNQVYWPENTTLFNGTGPAVETPFTQVNDSVYAVYLGPFNNSAQVVNSLHFVLHYSDDTWNNNNNLDWNINITQDMKIDEFTENVNIYPNPVHDYAFVDLKGEKGRFIIKLLDFSGKVITQTEVTAPMILPIKRGTLPAGVYFLQFTDVDNNKSFNKTLIFR